VNIEVKDYKRRKNEKKIIIDYLKKALHNMSDLIIFDFNCWIVLAFMQISPRLSSPKEEYSYIISNGQVYITAFAGTDKEVKILDTISEKPFTAIQELAFYNKQVENVYIPNGVKEIKERGFEKCFRLRNIEFPDSLNKIGQYGFRNCKGLKEIKLPSNLTSIEKGAFSNCSSLTEITIPEKITFIDDYTFSKCCNLQKVSIPDSVESIEENAFWMCINLENIKIPSSVTKIGKDEFSDCENLTIITPKGSYAEKYAIENGIAYRNE